MGKEGPEGGVQRHIEEVAAGIRRKGKSRAGIALNPSSRVSSGTLGENGGLCHEGGGGGRTVQGNRLRKFHF